MIGKLSYLRGYMTKKKHAGGRPSGEKTRCGGLWTQARFNSFIKSLLRSGTRRWGPIQKCLSKARVRRGWYLCAVCGEEVPATIVNDKGKRVKNAIVDHIDPIIDPTVGFTTWDDCIERMFCEEENLQCTCHACHTVKCAEERTAAAERRASEKEGV